MVIDRHSPVPLYYQLQEWLIDQIESGTWRPGDMLPAERELQDEFELSRTTVRQAIQELENRGLVTRYRGRGTFVAKPKVGHSPLPSHSLADQLLSQGMTAGWVVLSADWVEVPADVALRLQIEPEQQVYCLRRLRLANDEPIGYHIAYVSPEFAEAIDEDGLAKGGSLRYLRFEQDLAGNSAKRILEAIPATAVMAELLDVEVGAPMLQIRRVVLSPDERPIEDFCGVYRGDRFQYHINDLGLSIRSK